MLAVGGTGSEALKGMEGRTDSFLEHTAGTAKDTEHRESYRSMRRRLYRFAPSDSL